ncbi:MAG: GNAT family N-acetyltransferase [Thiomicrorhabdus sp.]|nr:GNAT family N-acetyltransferase [Thiomicrorhabdus sp.]
MKLKLVLEKAKKDHVGGICDLVNLAYRGEEGWTKETDLVGGNRATTSEIKEFMLDPGAHLLVAINNGEIVACVCIEKNESNAYIGFFAVHPKLQGIGVGKEILSQAESYASTKLNIRKYVMVVVSQRKELISYYERRGYRKTGNVQEYPTHLNVGVPLKKGLTIEYLEKNA